MKQTSHSQINRIKGLQKFIRRVSDLLETDGVFIQDPKNPEQFVKIPWMFFDEYAYNRLSIQIHMSRDEQKAEDERGIRQMDSPLIIGSGVCMNEKGAPTNFLGYKFRTPEHAYMFDLDPETLTSIESPVKFVEAVPRNSNKES